MSLKPKRVDFDLVWHDVRETVAAVITLSEVNRGVWNDRFSDVYSLCVAQPESLADRLYQETRKFLDDHVQGLLEKVKAGGEAQLLKNYNAAWNDYNRGIDYVHKLYLYLNQQHIKKQKLSDAEVTYGSFNADQQEQMKEIGELGLEIWKMHMVRPLQDLLLSQLLEAIELDRQGEGMSHTPSVIQGAILSLVQVEEYRKKQAIQLYEEIFENPFLAASGKFYRHESARLFQDCTVSQYMDRVLQKLEEEQVRCRKFLHPGSFAKVTLEFQQRFVGDRLEQLNGECHTLVKNENQHDLRNLYTLLRPLQGKLATLIEEVQEHIRQQGLQAVSDLAGETMHIQFVENILEVHQKYHTMIKDVFGGDQVFVGALDKACASVINHRPNPKMPCRSSELLAKYCDQLLKKSAKGLTESEIEDKLGQSITVFKYIDDKDVFQKFYARMLAKRLIHQQSQSMDAEEAMINRLKQACGYEFTNKLHRMFTDMAVSSDLNGKFSAHLEERGCDLGIHFSVNVLQAGAWPMGQSALTPFALPRELEQPLQSFEQFYHNHFSGRKLTWLHHVCNGELRLGYLKRVYLVTMQTFQMAILLHFEKQDSLGYGELQEMTQLADEHYGRHVQSLIDCRLLLCDTEELGSESHLRLNMDYSNKRTKLRISAAVQRETAQEVEQTHAAVDEDRKLYLQAAIVRIMKSRKLLKHNTLIQEVLSQSKARFAPSISLIKKCIETLIDKQYLERTPNSADEYSYVA